MPYRNIMRLIPTIQAASLAKTNIDVAKKKSSTKDILGLGMKNIVGVNIIKLESDLIAGL